MLQTGEVNPSNRTSFSSTYTKVYILDSILDSKKNLRVFNQMNEFHEMVEMVRRPFLNAQKDFARPRDWRSYHCIRLTVLTHNRNGFRSANLYLQRVATFALLPQPNPGGEFQKS